MATIEKLNYVEFPAKYLTKTKDFFSRAFGWSFIDYGPSYTAFENCGLDGGFFQSDLSSRVVNGSALLVILTDDLESAYAKVIKYGGIITQEIFEFPGGKRFHFTEPSGNELAVWTKL